MAKDPEQEGEILQFRISSPGESGALCRGLGQGLGAHRCLCISPESWDCP